MELTMNWHITEQCNYHCSHCFSKWGCRSEAWRDPVRSDRLLREISQAGQGKLAGIMDSPGDKVRLNFAGGEPLLLGSRLDELACRARELGMSTSIVSNGSLLSQDIGLVRHMDVIGLSIDSLDDAVIRRIGRATWTGKVIDLPTLARTLECIAGLNPRPLVKLNVVVTRHNWDTLLLPELMALQPDKIKVFRQVPFGNEPGITDFMFKAFLEHNQVSSDMVFVEDIDRMTGSYLMMDPEGRLFGSLRDGRYDFSDPVDDVGLAAAVEQLSFDPERYRARKLRIENHNTEVCHA